MLVERVSHTIHAEGLAAGSVFRKTKSRGTKTSLRVLLPKFVVITPIKHPFASCSSRELPPCQAMYSMDSSTQGVHLERWATIQCMPRPAALRCERTICRKNKVDPKLACCLLE